MKSEQKDQTEFSITTNCFDCIFYDGNNCEANRLSVMESKQRIIETEPHRLYGICNLKEIMNGVMQKKQIVLKLQKKI